MAAQRLIVGPAFPTVLEVLEDGRDAILLEPDDADAMSMRCVKGWRAAGKLILPSRAY